LEPIAPQVEALAKQTVDAAFRVHTTLGPGLLESVYEACLAQELRLRGISIECQVAVPIVYAGLPIANALRLDLIVGGELLVEVKASEKLLPIHMAQLLTYLKLTRKRLGLLVNFNVELIRDGIQRVVL
jgi:GxxExxY protein